MKWVLNLIIACALLLIGFIWGQMNKDSYINGMKTQCETMIEKAYNAGLSGCVD